jgi:hypothetical protein
MAELASTNEWFLTDIVGILNSTATPRTAGAQERSDAMAASLLTHAIINVSESANDSESTNKNERKREKEKNRQRRYRQRLKDTREVLQREVDDLSARLDQLSQQVAKQIEVGAMNAQVGNYRLIAEVNRLRRERFKSEAEHQRLLAAVDLQTAYINELRALPTTRRECEAVMTEYAAGIASRRNVPTLQSMTSVLYMTYLQQLEGCYARVDGVMDACDFSALSGTPINAVHTRRPSGEVAFFQHINKVSLPYNFRQTCRALWKLVYQQDEPALAGGRVAPDNDVFIKTRVLKSRDSGVLAQRCVSRLYKEDSRLTFVWKMSSQGECKSTGYTLTRLDMHSAVVERCRYEGLRAAGAHVVQLAGSSRSAYSRVLQSAARFPRGRQAEYE